MKFDKRLHEVLQDLPVEKVHDILSAYCSAIDDVTGHNEPSSATKQQLALNEQRFDMLEVTLKEVVVELTSAKNWVIAKLFAGIAFFFMGGWVISNWKSNVDYHLAIIDKELAELSK